MTLAFDQLAALWNANGGNPAMAQEMAGVAEVESSGNPAAENPSGATGLWQIEWPLYRGIVPAATSRQALTDPNVNAQAAIRLSQNNPSTAPGAPVTANWLAYEPPGAAAAAAAAAGGQQAATTAAAQTGPAGQPPIPVNDWAVYAPTDWSGIASGLVDPIAELEHNPFALVESAVPGVAAIQSSLGAAKGALNLLSNVTQFLTVGLPQWILRGVEVVAGGLLLGGGLVSFGIMLAGGHPAGAVTGAAKGALTGAPAGPEGAAIGALFGAGSGLTGRKHSKTAGRRTTAPLFGPAGGRPDPGDEQYDRWAAGERAAGRNPNRPATHRGTKTTTSRTVPERKSRKAGPVLLHDNIVEPGRDPSPDGEESF